MIPKRFALFGAAALAVAIFSAPAAALEDTTPNPRWQLGVKAGWDNAWFSGGSPGLWLSGADYQVDGSMGQKVAGFIGGGYIRFQLAPRFALQADVLYAMKGGKGAVTGTALIDSDSPGAPPQKVNINGTLSANLDYVEIPILAMFTAPTSHKTGIGIYGGVGLGAIVNATAHLSGDATAPLSDGSDRKQNFDQTYNIRSEVRDNDVTGIVGGNIEWETSHGRVMLEARYSQSLRTIDESGEEQVKNSVFSLMLGFAWGAGGEVAEK